MPTGTILFIDGPCRLQKAKITFAVQPPRTVTCRGTTYIYSIHQGVQYLNYVEQGGVNDTGGQGVTGQRDLFRSWSRLHHALNHSTPASVNRIRAAGAAIRRAVR